MKYITASGSQTVAAGADGLLIQVNTALTGTITLAAGAVTFAIITNPPAGTNFRYNGLRRQGAITVNPNGTCDITVSFLNRSV